MGRDLPFYYLGKRPAKGRRQLNDLLIESRPLELQAELLRNLAEA